MSSLSRRQRTNCREPGKGVQISDDMEGDLEAVWVLNRRSLLCQSGIVLRRVVSTASCRRRQIAGDQIVEETQCAEVGVKASVRTSRNSAKEASTLKPSCWRGSRVCKKPSRAVAAIRERSNPGSRISSHSILLKEC